LRQEAHEDTTFEKVKKPVIAVAEGIKEMTGTLLEKTGDYVEAAGDSLHKLTHKDLENLKDESRKERERNEYIDRATKETEGTRMKPALSSASEAIREGQQEAIRTGKDYRQAVNERLDKLPKEEKGDMWKVKVKEHQHEAMVPSDKLSPESSNKASNKILSESEIPEMKDYRSKDEKNRKYKDVSYYNDRKSTNLDEDARRLKEEQPAKVRELDDYGRKNPKPAWEYDTYIQRPDLKQSGVSKYDQREEKPLKEKALDTVKSFTPSSWWSDRDTDEYRQSEDRDRDRQRDTRYRDVDVDRERGYWEKDKNKYYDNREQSYWKQRDEMDKYRRDYEQSGDKYGRDSDYDRSYFQKAKDTVKETVNDTIDTAKKYGEEAKDKLKQMYKDPVSQYTEDEDRFKGHMRRNYQEEHPQYQDRGRVQDQYEEYQRPSRDDSFMGKIKEYFRGSNRTSDWWEKRESGDYSQYSENYKRSSTPEDRSYSPGSANYASSSKIPATTSPYASGTLKGLHDMRNTRTS